MAQFTRRCPGFDNDCPDTENRRPVFKSRQPKDPLGPQLPVMCSGNSVIVSWPSPSTGWQLQQCSDLAAGNGTTSGYTISASNSTNSNTLPRQRETCFSV